MFIRSIHAACPQLAAATILPCLNAALLAIVCCGWCATPCEAQPPFTPREPAPLEQPKKEELITHEHLEEFDRFRVKIDSARDNVFIYAEQRDEFLEAMSELPGTKLEWPATVVRVSSHKVELRHSQYGRTRLVLVHYRENGTFAFGSLDYKPPRCVTPSAYRYARHAATPELEIGLEIPLKLAKTLRAGDQVQLSGNIEHVDTRLIMGNAPDTLLYVANVQARKYLTMEELDELEDKRRAAAQDPASPAAPAPPAAPAAPLSESTAADEE